MLPKLNLYLLCRVVACIFPVTNKVGITLRGYNFILLETGNAYTNAVTLTKGHCLKSLTTAAKERCGNSEDNG